MTDTTPLVDDWQFGSLNIYNYRRPGKLLHYFNFIMEHCEHLEGDIIEAGVYKGRSLLATGLLLKDFKSDKKVYGFDSFKGLPPKFHDNDHVSKFIDLCAEDKITLHHFTSVQLNLLYKQALMGTTVYDAAPDNISSSGNFADVEWDLLLQKLNLLDLNNIILVPGFFEDTMTHQYTAGSMHLDKIMAALLDCDLYASYKIALPFLWDRLVPGGYMFLDEYYSLKYPGPRFAVDEFFEDKKDKPQRHAVEYGQFERWFVRKIYEE